MPVPTPATGLAPRQISPNSGPGCIRIQLIIQIIAGIRINIDTCSAKAISLSGAVQSHQEMEIEAGTTGPGGW